MLNKIIFTFFIFLFGYFLNVSAQTQPQQTNSSFQSTQKLIEDNHFEEALLLALQQLDKSPKQSLRKAKWLILIGEIYYRQEEYNLGLNYFKKARKICITHTDSLLTMKSNLKIGKTYQAKFNLHYDSLYSTTATQLRDSTLKFYRLNTDTYRHIKNNDTILGNTFSNLAFIYADYDKLDSAMHYIDTALFINKQIYVPNHEKILASKNNKGLIYIYQQKYPRAIELSTEVLKQAIDTSNLNILNKKKIAALNLRYIYKQLGNYEKALYYTDLKNDINNQITARQKATQIRAIDAQYNVEKATQEERLNTISAEKAHQKTLFWSAIGALIAVVIILIGSLLYRNSKLKTKNLSLHLTQQQLSEQEKIQKLLKQNQQKILNATLDGREKERKEIAQILHDSVSALLSSVAMHLQVVKKKSPTEIEELSKSQRIVSEASDKVRDLSHQLLSATLIKFGLGHALDDLCDKYSNDALSIELICSEIIPRFQQETEIKLYAIIEELINNIIKHSKATYASIDLEYSNDILTVIVTDNGIGFSLDKLSPDRGVGLTQVMARIDNLNGSIRFNSKPNSGTSISINLPLS